MADALLSPAVGATMWAATGAATVYAAKRVRDEADPAKVPLMGVTGAFVFAAQMINFTIPGTGSSGHLGGGLILAILLGPWPAFLVMASVLTVQALFFADGGLLALGANVFNLAVFPAFVAYPLVYRRIVGDSPTRVRIVTGSVLAALVGLTLGAGAVVLETTLSGISELPFATFGALMLPIHLAIGLVEGAVTAAVVLFVHRAQPEILRRVSVGRGLRGVSMRTVIVGLAVAAVVTGAALSWFASADPDGLEWSIAGVTGASELDAGEQPVHGVAAALQSITAFLPDYALPGAEAADDERVNAETAGGEEPGAEAAAREEPDAGRTATGPAPDVGTSISGLVGGALTLLIAVAAGFALSRRRKGGASPANGG